MQLTQEQINANKAEIIALLRSTKRKGIENVINYLENESYFFTAKGSAGDSHHAWRGGLAQHSLGVYRKAKALGASLPADSLIIAALLHDICKAKPMCFVSRNRPCPFPKSRYASLQDKIKRHGVLSVAILQMPSINLALKKSEELAILKHMHGVDILSPANGLWSVIHASDELDATISSAIEKAGTRSPAKSSASGHGGKGGGHHHHGSHHHGRRS